MIHPQNPGKLVSLKNYSPYSMQPFSNYSIFYTLDELIYEMAKEMRNCKQPKFLAIYPCTFHSSLTLYRSILYT